MKQQIIPIMDQGGTPTVNARDLWEKLESKQRFADWIKDRIEKYGFNEHEDFFVILGKSTGGRPSTEYHLTMDMAKELAMVENNEMGRTIRRYFIQCEKKLRNRDAEYRKIRADSKTTRNHFTAALADHGYTKKHEFIQTTRQMKRVFGISSAKDVMKPGELKLIAAAELIASFKIDESDLEGYHEVNPVCVDSSRGVLELAGRKKLIGA